MAIAHFFTANFENVRYFTMWWEYLVNDLFYPLKTPAPEFVLINSIGTSVILYRVLTVLDGDAKNITIKPLAIKAFIQTFAIVTLIYIALYGLGAWGAALLIFSYVIFILYAFIQLSEDSNMIKSFSAAWKLTTSNFSQVLGLQLVLILMSLSFLLILSAPLIYMNTTILQWNFAKTDVWANRIIHFIELFIKIFGFNLVVPILAASAAYMYFSLYETVSARHLKKLIAMVGQGSKNRKR